MNFSILTYNILADAHVRPVWYTHVPSGVLSFENRSQRLLQTILSYQADIICLQEVGKPYFDYFDQQIRDDYLGFVAYKQGSEDIDGCAIWVRKAKFAVISHQVHLYADATILGAISGHIAFCMVLQFIDAQSNGTQIGIMNTHIKWNQPNLPREERWATYQLADISTIIATMPDIEWIVCGDYNLAPNDFSWQILTEAGLHSVWSEEHTPYTCYANSRFHTLDYVCVSAGLHILHLQYPVLTKDSVIPSLDHPSDHIPVRVEFEHRRMQR